MIIIDEYSENKMLSVGEVTGSGFQLISSNSHIAIFKDPQGNLIQSGLSDDISIKFNQNEDIVESIALNEKNQYLTNILINGHKKSVPAVVDTGANLVTLSGDLATNLEIIYQNNNNKVKVATASESTFGYKIKLKSIQLGNIVLENIDCLVIEGNDPELVLLGMSFLKLLEIKYADQKLELKTVKNK